MKHMKKIASLVLALIMVFAMTFTASAADGETYTITINNETTGHTYEAYQIFAGDLYNGKLSNIEWGTGVTEAGKTALGNASSKAETLKSEADAKAFAEEVAQYLSTTKTESTRVGNHYEISDLEPGYYLIKDQSGTVSGDDTYTGYILKVVGDVTTSPKGDKPTVEKKVDDENDSTDAENGEDWQDSADYDIGDNVPFKLTGTLPSNYADYDYYTYIFHDTLSKGLTYNGDAKVYVVNGGVETEITDAFVIATETGANGSTELTISCDNLKAIEGVTIDANSKIVVKYTATLNKNANIGAAGNPNEVYLEYSNNPNNTGDGDNTTGETPEDKVIVFTFKMIINKIDQDRQPLAGAEFTLEKQLEDGTWETVEVIKNADGTTFTFAGLDDGFYRVIETKTPDGYNSIDPIYFTVTATHDITAADPQLTDLVVTLTDKNGNALADQETGEFVISVPNGTITADIVNNSGVELPSTGGIGTTIFYVIGGTMMLVAAILLITKKKMSGQMN